jgi:hypothetical protein
MDVDSTYIVVDGDPGMLYLFPSGSSLDGTQAQIDCSGWDISPQGIVEFDSVSVRHSSPNKTLVTHQDMLPQSPSLMVYIQVANIGLSLGQT